MSNDLIIDPCKRSICWLRYSPLPMGEGLGERGGQNIELRVYNEHSVTARCAHLAMTWFIAIMILSFMLAPIPVYAATNVSDTPVPGKGIRIEVTDEHNPDQGFHTCTDDGWVKAPYYSYKSSSEHEWWVTLESIAFYTMAFLIIYLLCKKLIAPFIAVFLIYPILQALCLALTAGLTATVVAFHIINKNKIESSASVGSVPMFSTEKFKKREVVTKIELTDGFAFSLPCVPIPIPFVPDICFPEISFHLQAKPIFQTINDDDLENYVGIYHSLLPATGNNVAYPVSNSAHSLCHIIRCANQLFESPEAAEAVPVNNSCAIFKQITADRFETKYIQDLKNYIGLSELQRMKYIAQKKLQPTPFFSHSQHHGITGGAIRIMSDNIAPTLDKQMVENFYLNRVGNSNVKTVLAQRISSMCSLMEGAYCSPVSLRFTDRKYDPATKSVQAVIKRYQLDYPKDLMASSMFRESVYSTGIANYTAHAVMKNLLGIAPLPLKPNDEIFDRDKNSLDTNVFKAGGAEHLLAKFQLMSSLANSGQSLKDSYLARQPWGISGAAATGLPVSSKLSVLEAESTRRFQDQKWYEMMSVAGEDNITREIVIMKALKLQSRLRLAKHLEKLELLLASNIGVVQNRVLSNEAKNE